MRQNIQYVSFDVFDTLIHRLVSVGQIYSKMEEILHSEGIMEHFVTRRIGAERQLKDSGKETYTLEDIYSSPYFSDIAQDDLKRSMALEVQMELDNVFADDNAQHLFRQYETEYPIICISDMYFDNVTIKEMLRQAGYEPERIYVSSDTLCSKRNRKLFHFVANDLHVSTCCILHMGDSPRSDWLNAHLAGCQSHWIRSSKKKRIAGSYAYQLGFCLFGPLTLEFCRWIYRHDSGEKPLLFLSREGEFFKQCYDLLYPGNTSAIFYVSRQSILQCMAFDMLQQCPIEEFRAAIHVVPNERIGDALRRIGLNVECFQATLNAYALSPEDQFDQRIDKFFLENKSAILHGLKKQNDSVAVQYLNQCLAKGNTLVDIGWRGTMQKLLQKFIQLQKQEWTLKGLYLAIDDNNGKEGFLYQKKDRNRHNVRCFSQLLEVVFTPNHGSVIGYQNAGGSIEPVFAQSEFGEASSCIVGDMQRGILDLLKRSEALHAAPQYQLDEILRDLIHFGCHPCRKDLELFGSLEYFDSGRVYRLIENASLLHPKKMYESFLRTRWKTGFLKQVFKLDLPYNWFVNFLRQVIPDKK